MLFRSEANNPGDGGALEEYASSCFWGPLTRIYINTDEYTGYESIETALSRIRACDVDRVAFVLHEIEQPRTVYMTLFMKEDFVYRTEAPDPRSVVVFPEGYAWESYFYHPV